MTNLAEVVTLYEANSRDIPRMLRDMAERIESGDEEIRTESVVAIEFLEDGSLKLYGIGDIDGYKTLAVLQLALHEHSNRMLP